jgi:hypothetical protein
MPDMMHVMRKRTSDSWGSEGDVISTTSHISSRHVNHALWSEIRYLASYSPSFVLLYIQCTVLFVSVFYYFYELFLEDLKAE